MGALVSQAPGVGWSQAYFTGWLAYNGTYATSPDNGPDEEGYARARHKISLDGEQVANLVDRKPDGGQ